MPKYVVETRATVRRRYLVEAENEQDAIAKSCSATMEREDDESEETLAVVDSDPARARMIERGLGYEESTD